MVIYLEDRFVTGHGEGAFWIIKSLELHGMILRTQQYALEVRHKETSDSQDLKTPFIDNYFIVKGSLKD